MVAEYLHSALEVGLAVRSIRSLTNESLQVNQPFLRMLVAGGWNLLVRLWQAAGHHANSRFYSLSSGLSNTFRIF